MQEKPTAEITLEKIHRDILFSTLLSLNLKDLSNLSITSKFWNALYKEFLEKFDTQLAYVWIEKIKTEIVSDIPEPLSIPKVRFYKGFYTDNMIEKPPNKATSSVTPRKIEPLLAFDSFTDKVKSYSGKRFDVQLSRLFANNPGLTKYLYSYHFHSRDVLTFIRDAMDSGFKKIFDLHFATFKKFTDNDISTAINDVDQNKQQSLLHCAVQKANIYCLKVLLENGGDPLVKAFSTQKTCFTIANNIEGEKQNAVFNLLLANIGKDKLNVDISNLNSDQFQDEYGISKSLMFEHTQNHQQILHTDICQETESSNLGFKK